jgi:hypothetical protein
MSDVNRWKRWFAPIILAMGLVLGPAPSRPVYAQVGDPNAVAEPEGGDKGRPLDGYLGTLCLVMFTLFVVAKSARR